MGQVFDEDGVARQGDVDALRQALVAQPAQCKPGAPPPQRGAPLDPAVECPATQHQHGVVVGASWGSLPAAGQLRWQRLACDAFVSTRPTAKGLSGKLRKLLAKGRTRKS